MGCDGNLDLGDGIAGGPFSLKANGFNKILKFLEAQQVLNMNGSCGCNGLTEAVVRKFLRVWSPEFLLNLAQGFDAEQYTPTDPACEALFDISDIPKIDLPASCSLERWLDGDDCQIGLDIGSADVKLLLRADRCDNSDFPFFELSCVGDDCSHMFSMCSADSDCPGALTCMPLTDTKKQCVKQTCRGSFDIVSERAAVSDCSVGAINPAPVVGGCALAGHTVPVGFKYSYDTGNPNNNPVPQSVQDVTNCVTRECVAGGQWQDDSSNVSARDCFEDMTDSGPPELGVCSGSEARVANKAYPFSYENTCNYRSVEDGAVPFLFGQTRYLSNAQEGLGGLMQYDETDLAKDPFGCTDQETLAQGLKTTMRRMTESIHDLSNTPLSVSSTIGLCMIGSGYTLLENDPYAGAGPFPARPNIGNTPCKPQCQNQLSTCTLSGSIDNFCNCQLAFLNCHGPEVCGEDYFSVDSIYDSARNVCNSGGSGVFSTFEPKALEEDTNQILEDNLDVSCGVTTSPTGKETLSCGSNFEADESQLDDDEKFNGDDERRVRLANPVTPGATVIAHVNCAGSVALHPNHPVLGMEMSMTGALEIYDYLFGMHEQTWDCRAAARGGQPLSDEQYRARSLALDNVLYHLTSPVATQLTDLGTPFLDFSIGDAGARVELPSSCSFDSWFTDGQCRVSFTSLGDDRFFGGNDIKINAYANECPTNIPFLPEIYVECEGKMCDMLNGPIPCATNSECPAGNVECMTFDQIQAEFNGENDDNNNGNSNSNVSYFESEFAYSFDQYELTDLVQDLGPQAMQFDQGMELYAQVDSGNAPITVPSGQSIDLGQYHVKVYVQLSADDFSGGVSATPVTLVDGAVTGKFDEVVFSTSYSSENPSCSSIQGEVIYLADKVQVKSTCDCTFKSSGRRRKRSEAEIVADAKEGVAAMKREIETTKKASVMKRSVEQFDEPAMEFESTADVSLVSLLLGLFGGNKDTCDVEDLALNDMLPRLLYMVSSLPYDATKKNFCFPKLSLNEVEEWAEDQVEEMGDRVRFNNLVAWGSSKVTPVDNGASLHGLGWFDGDVPKPTDATQSPLNPDSGSTIVVSIIVSMFALIQLIF